MSTVADVDLIFPRVKVDVSRAIEAVHCYDACDGRSDDREYLDCIEKCMHKTAKSAILAERYLQMLLIKQMKDDPRIKLKTKLE